MEQDKLNNLEKIDSLLEDALFLQAQMKLLESDKATVMQKVVAAKKWLQKQPEYLKFLEHLQNIFHQENIEIFSELLTYFVQDVLQKQPGKEKEIVFEIYTYHNLPALRINTLNGNKREDIYFGNGGSLTNIVCTGLRLIALSRMENRRFVILDEPDCWLNPEYVGVFSRIIGEISAKLNIQTVIISHLSWEFFKDYGRVIRLSQEGNYLETEILHDNKYVADEGDDIIKSIRLMRFMSHYDTTIELHPHLTCIVGAHDIGKSVISVAMSAVAYNDVGDACIMHNEGQAQVVIELSGDRTIQWNQYREKSIENPQKVKYSLFLEKQSGKPVRQEYSSYETPDFITKELKICKVEDIDVHIANQKQPVFLLSPDVKPQQRAKLFSLGKESIYIQKMMEKIKSSTRQCKRDERDGEAQFNVIVQKLGVLENIEKIVESSKVINKEVKEAIEQFNRLGEFKGFYKSWADFINLSEIGLIDLLEEPNIVPIEDGVTLRNNLFVSTELAYIKKIEDIDVPNIESVEDDIVLLKNLIIEKGISEISMIDDFNTPNIEDVSNGVEIYKSLKVFDAIAQLSLIDMDIDIDLDVEKMLDIQKAREGVKKWRMIQGVMNVGEIEDSIGEVSLMSLDELISMRQNWQEVINELVDLKKEIEKIDALLEKSNLDIQTCLEGFNGMCPTCNQPVDDMLSIDCH